MAKNKRSSKKKTARRKSQKTTPKKSRPKLKRTTSKGKRLNSKQAPLLEKAAASTSAVRRTSSLATLGTAPTKPCLQLPAAIQLVRSCSNVDPQLPLSTVLGQIFPSPTGRQTFCQCVANGVPIDRSEVPCNATNTLQDVVDAISC